MSRARLIKENIEALLISNPLLDRIKNEEVPQKEDIHPNRQFLTEANEFQPTLD